MHHREPSCGAFDSQFSGPSGACWSRRGPREAGAATIELLTHAELVAHALAKSAESELLPAVLEDDGVRAVRRLVAESHLNDRVRPGRLALSGRRPPSRALAVAHKMAARRRKDGPPLQPAHTCEMWMISGMLSSNCTVLLFFGSRCCPQKAISSTWESSILRGPDARLAVRQACGQAVWNLSGVRRAEAGVGLAVGCKAKGTTGHPARARPRRLSVS